MYPAEDIAVQLGLAALRSRSLQEEIGAQLARMAALNERAHAAVRDAEESARAAGLIREVEEILRTSRELVADAREHGERSRLLVQRSRMRRRMRELA